MALGARTARSSRAVVVLVEGLRFEHGWLGGSARAELVDERGGVVGPFGLFDEARERRVRFSLARVVVVVYVEEVVVGALEELDVFLVDAVLEERAHNGFVLGSRSLFECWLFGWRGWFGAGDGARGVVGEIVEAATFEAVELAFGRRLLLVLVVGVGQNEDFAFGFADWWRQEAG